MEAAIGIEPMNKGFAELWNLLVPTCKCLYLHVLFYTLDDGHTTAYKQIQTITYYRFYYRIFNAAERMRCNVSLRLSLDIPGP